MWRLALTHCVEGLCILLMAVLTADIFLGVFSRYVLGNTFIWYDEVARACFVWLVFLGAAVGVRQAAHFRFHLVLDRVPAPARQAAEVFGFGALILFATLLIQKGWTLVELGHFQRTPVMGMPRSWIYLAVPVGGALMILYALPHLWRAVRQRRGGGARGEPAERLGQELA